MKISVQKLEMAMADACLLTTDLCRTAEINCSTLSRIKSGKDANPSTVGKIAKALGVTVQELIETEAATSNQLNRDSENNQN